MPIPSASPSCLSLMPIPSASPSCLSLMPIPSASPSCLSLMPIPSASPSCLSLMPIPHASPSCLSLMPLPHASPSCLSLMPIPHAYPSCLSLMPLPHASPSCLSLMPLPHATPSCLSRVPLTRASLSGLSLRVHQAITIVQVAGFGGAADALGGASYNPLTNLINYLADEDDETALGLLLRLPAQAGGMVIGAMLTWKFIPESLKHTVNGPALPPGVSVLAGATAEFTLTFLLFLVVMWTLFLGPSSDRLKEVIMVSATIVVIAAGMGFSGPSLNPLFAFGWVYTLDQEMSVQHFIVYWAAPTAGAVLAAAFYRIYLKPHKAALEAKRRNEREGKEGKEGREGKAGESGKGEEEAMRASRETKGVAAEREGEGLRKRVGVGAREEEEGRAEVNNGGGEGRNKAE
ncbi:unnamed protein product [Closterium sp. NIES-64]|nr:unnamed protein product [Closterium sp. NIES-64]